MQDERTPPRRVVFDVLKGIGIVEVVLHHSLSHSARKFTEPFTAEWWVLRTLNRIFHFAIPLFLLVSATLLTASLVKNHDWKRYGMRRVVRSLWPYLLWSALYWLFRVQFLKVGSDTEIVSATYPVLGTLTGPQLFVDLPNLWRELLTGKAYFHLYFLVVLLQLAIVLPAIVWSVRRLKPSFLTLLGTVGGLQICAFLLQRFVFRYEAPASTFLWYLPSLFLGAWIGLDTQAWQRMWQRARRSFGLSAVVGLTIYLPLALALSSGTRLDSILFNSAFAFYTVALALWLMGIAPSLAQTRWGSRLALFGQVSLPMFLIHPIILFLTGGPRVSAFIGKIPGAPLWNFLIVLGASYALARLAMVLRLDLFVFGQRLPGARSKEPVSAPAPVSP